MAKCETRKWQRQGPCALFHPVNKHKNNFRERLTLSYLNPPIEGKLSVTQWGKKASGAKKGTKQRQYYKVIKMVSLQITALGGWHTMKRGVKEGDYLLALIC